MYLLVGTRTPNLSQSSTHFFAARKQKFSGLGSCELPPMFFGFKLNMFPPCLVVGSWNINKNTWGVPSIRGYPHSRNPPHLCWSTSLHSGPVFAKKRCHRWHLPWWPSPLCLRTPHLQCQQTTDRIQTGINKNSRTQTIILAKLQYRFWKLLASEVGIFEGQNYPGHLNLTRAAVEFWDCYNPTFDH